MTSKLVCIITTYHSPKKETEVIFTDEKIAIRNRQLGDEMKARLAASPAKDLSEITDLITGSIVRRLDVLSPQISTTNHDWRVDAECDRLAKRCCEILDRHYLTETWLLLTCTEAELLGMSYFGPKMLAIVNGCLAYYDLALRKEK